MQVIQVYMNNSLRNYNYIIYSELTKEAIFIDPYCLEQTYPVAYQHNLKPMYLLNTHHHHDHIKDNKKFLEDDSDRKHLKLNDREVFKLSETEEVLSIHTPGHVDDHYCFLLKQEGKQVGIISGDAIFNAGIGNTKNGGNLDKHFQSTKMLNELLDENVKLYPSHDYLLTNLKFSLSIEQNNKHVKRMIEIRESQNLDREFINTTIGEEREINPFFRLNELKKLRKYKDFSEKELFLHIRKLRDKF